jgi:hypothetical protein
MSTMLRWVINIVAVLLILAGLVWSLQGLNILLGSPMSGQNKWVINGLIAIVAGLAILFVTNRRRRAPPTS